MESTGNGKSIPLSLLNCEVNFFSARENISEDGRLLNRNRCQIVNTSEGELKIRSVCQHNQSGSSGPACITCSSSQCKTDKSGRHIDSIVQNVLFAGSIASTSNITGKERARQLTG